MIQVLVPGWKCSQKCQCKNCWYAMPDGGEDDCFYCEGCLEDKPMIECKKYDPIESEELQ